MDHEHHAPRSGRLEIPRRLWKLLPSWQRHWNAIFTTPISIAALVAVVLGYSLAGGALLGAAIALHLVRFWVARAFLIRHGKWEPGAWHTEVLPSIYRWRALFFALLSLSVVGTCLIVGAKIHARGITIVTVIALALLAPAYVQGSIVQGRIGNWPIFHYRSDEPGRFWMGLCTYAGVIALLSAMAIFVVLKATSLELAR